ncbi:MAG: FHA domain-containing protein [Planctomycetota bacterium]|nr:FHA domain-containing protein [Planctomycetota bacterium]
MGILRILRQGREVGIFPLGPTPILAGRSEECAIRLACEYVSRRHAVFVERDGVAGVRNLSASNPTLLNGKPIEGVVRLQPGDRLQLGSYEILYAGAPSAAASVSARSKTRILKMAEGKEEAEQKSTVPEEAQIACAAAAVGPPSTAAGMPNGISPLPAEKGLADTASSSDVTLVMTRPANGEKSSAAPPAAEEVEEEIVKVPAKAEAESVAVGEFDAEEIEGEEAAPPPAATEGWSPLEMTPAMREVVAMRLAVFAELEALEQERQAMLGQEGLPEAAIAELRRQSREAQNLPLPESVRQQMSKQEERYAALQAKVAAGEAKPLSAAEEKARQLGLRQWQAILRRDSLSAQVESTFLPLAASEPLYRLFQRQGIAADALFAWSFYAVAVESLHRQSAAERRSLQSRLSDQESRGRGLLGFWRGSAAEKTDDLQSAEREAAAFLSRCSREVAALAPLLIEAFWRVYEPAAVILARRAFRPEEEPYLRAFLRYGLLSVSPHFILPDRLAAVLADCQQPLTAWDDAMAANHVLYADEYIEAVARGWTTPAIDENLELNERQSERWKGDKAWRRLIHSRVRTAALHETRERLLQRVHALRDKQEELEAQREKLIRHAPDYQKRQAELSQRIQHCRVEAARYERAVARIEDDFLPRQEEARREAEQKIKEAAEKDKGDLPPEALARREAVNLRRICRLCCNLKEVFPPFALRDFFRPQSPTINDRATVIRELEKVEKADPCIFSVPLMPVKKKVHRIYLRYAPTLVIAPGCGFLAYAWNPRAGPEVGRLAVPLCLSRPQLRERMFANLFADFRWDTSKAESGVDALLSDTLVAAYATVRWEYRKSGREVREKAGIYLEENDRRNWRRHYALYLASAHEGGRKLFFKCPEVYEQVIVPYIDFPEGVERLRR